MVKLTEIVVDKLTEKTPLLSQASCVKPNQAQCQLIIQTAPLLNLPRDLLIEILNILSDKELAIIARTCKFLNIIQKDSSLWAVRAIKRFPSSKTAVRAINTNGRINKLYRNQSIQSGYIKYEAAQLLTEVKYIETNYEPVRSNFGFGLCCGGLLAGAVGMVCLYFIAFNKAHDFPFIIAATVMASLFACCIIGALCNSLKLKLDTISKNEALEKEHIHYNNEVIKEYSETFFDVVRQENAINKLPRPRN